MTSRTDADQSLLERGKTLIVAPATRRWGLRFGIFFLVFGLLGFFAGPPLLKSVLLRVMSEQLHRTVTVDRIDINPYALSARVSGLAVRADDGREVLAFDELLVNVSSRSLILLGAVFDEIQLRGPRVSVVRQTDGRYDISDLLEEWMKPSPPTPTPRFSLNNIQISGGRIEFDDQPVGRKHLVSDLNLNLPFISSLAYSADVWVEPGFSATVDGSPLKLSGKSRPFSASHESELQVDIDAYDLAAIQPYLPDGFPLRLTQGRLDAELHLHFLGQAPAGSDNSPSLQISGKVGVSGLRLSENDGSALLAWNDLQVALAAVDPLNGHYALGDIDLKQPELWISDDRRGQLNLLRLAERLSGKAKAEVQADRSGKAPSWSVNAVHLAGGKVRWADISEQRPVRGELRQFAVETGPLSSDDNQPLTLKSLSGELDFGEALKARRLEIRDVAAFRAEQRLEIGQVHLDGSRLKVVRNKAGEIEWLKPPRLASAGPEAKTAAGKQGGNTTKVASGKPWTVNLASLAVNDLGLRFEDQGLSHPAVQRVDQLELTVRDLSTAPGKLAMLALKATVNEKGRLGVDGSLQVSPLKGDLKLETVAVPLMPLQPYFTEYLNVALTRGLMSNKGEISVAISKEQPQVNYRGNLTLGDLLLVDKAHNADLLKWKSLYFGNMDIALAPLAVKVGEIALADFYSRLIVSKEGKLNLSQLLREKKEDKSGGKSESSPNPTAAVPPPSPSSASDPGIPIQIGRISVQGGTLQFSDYFVQPNYSVTINRLAGQVSKLSSSDKAAPADMELRGVYANAAPVTIKAKLNPLAARAALDLQADVKGVDLVPFSPYSGKYAGYAIEKGKLSLNVAYQLNNGQLTADNRLFIDQLTFGDKVDSPTATSLPVNLAIALLKNNRGEIDLNLPISGSLDDPQFSLGGLIFKVIGNLIVKAVTSPFALIGQMFAGGEELSNVNFAPGRASLDDAALKRLEIIAKAMRERDGLKLEITGRANPETDLEGIKRVVVDRAIRAEKQKEMIRRNKDSASLDSLEITPAEYPVFLKKAYSNAKFPKPRNLIGLQKDLPIEDMEKLMLTNQPAGPEDVTALAARRAETVQAWLIEQGKVPGQRIFLLPSKVGSDDKKTGGRADFSLR